MASQQGINVKKHEDFSEWYQQVMIKADLADYSSVSGCIVFKPYAYAIWENIVKEVDKRFKKVGLKNAYFPLFIPEKLLSKEKEHVEGFSPEVAWVTQAGKTELAERLAVRPTSETIMYESYSRWIRSWRDLPLRLNQWNNVVRWEFKHPVPFLRTREFLWNEGHTVFADKREANKEAKQIMKVYREICEKYLALYGLEGRKSEKEKFAGAEYTISLEYLMPNGKGVQGPDFHFDGQNFAKAFNIKFLDKDGKEKYVWQNTFAITTRMIGVMIAIHGDNKGLILPPRIAPNKVVIIPILFDETKDLVLKKAKEIFKRLKRFDPILDDRLEYSPGYKFNEWELKGIPLRVEIGPKDLENDSVVLVRRDNGEKNNIQIEDLSKEISKLLNDIQESLFKKSKKFLEDHIVEVDDFDSLKKEIKKGNMVIAPHCGKAKCEDEIKAETKGVTTRCIVKGKVRKTDKCIKCNRKAKYKIYFAKAY